MPACCFRSAMMVSAHSPGARFARPWINVLFVIALTFLLRMPNALAADTLCPNQTSIKLVSYTPQESWLGGRITVKTDGLKTTVGATLCDITLRLNGQALSELPRLIDPAAEQITFTLKRVAADNEAWLPTIGSPPLSGFRNVSVTIGLNKGADFANSGDIPKLHFVIFDSTTAWMVFPVLAAALSAFIWIARVSDILRDRIPGAVPTGSRLPYSLALCQMAFWFWFSLIAFIVIYIVSGDYNGIMTSQILTLLGISATTGVAATVVTASQGNANATTTASPLHESVLVDLLTDSTGYVLHRIQIVAWTIILAAISINSMYHGLTLPAFDDNLLTMMAISGGTYVGFKFPEKQK